MRSVQGVVPEVSWMKPGSLIHEIGMKWNWLRCSQASGTSKFYGFKRNVWKIQAGKNAQLLRTSSSCTGRTFRLMTDSLAWRRVCRISPFVSPISAAAMLCRAKIKSRTARLVSKCSTPHSDHTGLKNIKVYQSWRDVHGLYFANWGWNLVWWWPLKGPLPAPNRKKQWNWLRNTMRHVTRVGSSCEWFSF